MTRIKTYLRIHNPWVLAAIITMAIFAVWLLCRPFFNVRAAALNVWVGPTTTSTDNLIGQRNSSWKLNISNAGGIALASSSVIVITLPTINNGQPWGNTQAQNPDGTLANITATTTDFRLNDNTTAVGKVWMSAENTLVVQIGTQRQLVAGPFTLTLIGLTNPVAETNSLTSLVWGVKTATLTNPSAPQGPNSTVDGPSNSNPTSVGRRGNAIETWSFTPASYAASASTTFTFTFTATSTLVAGSKIVWQMPTGFELNSATTSPQGDINGGGAGAPRISGRSALSVSDQNVTFTTSDASIVPGNTVTLVLENVKNPIKGSYRYFKVYTTTNNNGLIDGNIYGMDAGQGGPAPVDSIQIGGDNTVTGTVRYSNGTALNATDSARVQIGMGNPDQGFFVGNKRLNSDGTFTYSNLLSARYYLFVMPANFTGDMSFFENMLQPSMVEANLTGGQTLTVNPTFGTPDTVIEGRITRGPALSTSVDVKAYNGLYESHAPVMRSSTSSQMGLNANGNGYFKIRAKSGSVWNIDIMTFSSGENRGALQSNGSNLWPPKASPVSIAAGSTATTTLSDLPFTPANKVIAVTLQKSSGAVIEIDGGFQGPTPCLSARRPGAMEGPGGQGVCSTMRTGATASTAVFQLKVPAGSFSVQVMQPGMGFKEYPVTTGAGATTTMTIIVSSPGQYIQGTVYDSDSFTISGVPVFAEGSNGSFSQGMTNSSGVYTLYVAAGTYTVKAFAPGYGPLTPITGVVVAEGSNTTSGTNFTISNAGFKAISGRIYYDANSNSSYDDGTDTPYGGVQVFAHSSNGGNGAVTATDGSYTLRVPSGTGYTVGAWSQTLGKLAEYTAVDATDNVTKNWLVGTTGSVKITVTGAAAAGEMFAHAFNFTTKVGNGTNVWTVSGSNKVAYFTLPTGTYNLEVGSPAFGSLGSLAANSATTTLTITASHTTMKTFALPTRVTISGTVLDGASGVSGATVWVSRIDGPGNFATTTVADGTYALIVPSGYTYDLGARLPSYIGTTARLTSVSTDTTQDLTLTTSGAVITGTVKNSSNTAIYPGFVWASKVGADIWSNGEIEADGSFSLDVDSGSWTVYAKGPCYNKSDGVVKAGGETANIVLSAISGCTVPVPDVHSMTPSTGGAIKKDNVEITIPANALGSGSSNVSVSVSDTSVVPPATPNAAPISNSAKTITSTNSSNSAITSLTNNVDIKISYSEDDIPAGANEADMQMGYWNETTNTWDAISATVDTTNNTITGSTNHFSTFAPIFAVGVAGLPSTPTGLAASAASASQINLSWTRTTDATSYDIYRDTNPSGSFARLGSEPTVSSGDTVSYSDTGLSASTRYYYKISALNDNGESAASSAVDATTSAAAQTSTPSGGGGSPTLSVPAPIVSSSSININGGAAITNSSVVTLNFKVAATKMAISNTADFKDVNWQDYKDSISWDLGAGTGKKTVYVKFSNNYGGVTDVKTISINVLEAETIFSMPSAVPPRFEINIPSLHEAKTILKPAILAFVKTIKAGARGDEVKALQKFLNANGFTIAKTGPGSIGNETDTFGSLTRQALIKFQRANNLKAEEGTVGVKTREFINSAKGTVSAAPAAIKTILKPAILAFVKTIKAGARGDEVKALQKFLNANGFIITKTGPGSAGNETDFFGALTRQALIKFQEKNNLKNEAGTLGAKTIEFINKLKAK